ncbi:MAG: hypothetical protein C0514_05035 [Candidatus Puniceispirillum sp.]|nr:hypothetical protein [Candidatus Puniceispirillum sp.]
MFARIRIFMLACLVAMPPLLASDEKLIFTLNDHEVRAKINRNGVLGVGVDENHVVLDLKDCAGILGGYSPETKERRWDEAHALYTDISTCSPAHNNTRWSRNSHKLMWQNLVATGGPIKLGDAEHFDAHNDILCARGDITLSAQTLCLKNTFCTSDTGQITLNAPEGCSGWLRSLTFERAPGVRPFDMMFDGTVCFNPPTIETLLALGANKVTFKVQRLN